MPKILSGRRNEEIKHNVKPFTKAESHFTDVSFFEEDNTTEETMSSTITLMGKGSTKMSFKHQKEDVLKE